MPFTLCHPAAVLPLHGAARRLSSLSALVIGSMAPDFVYFLSLGISGSFSHSLAGVLLYCVPAGALAYVVYHVLLREAFIAWAPASVAARMPERVSWLPRDLRTAGVVLASLAVGAASHVAWDAFTHANTVVVRHVALLREPVLLGGHTVPLFRLLQHMSSVVGFIVIAGYAASWHSRTEPGPPPRGQLSARQRLYVLVLVATAGAAGSAVGLLTRPAKSFEHGLFNAVVSGMAMAALAILLLSAGRRISSLRSRSSRTPAQG